MRKNTWYAVYHQRELEYLARSYQPGYFFILMGSGIDLTDYLPIDGSKPMSGNLEFDLHNTYYVGSATKKLKRVYAVSAELGTLVGSHNVYSLTPVTNNAWWCGGPPKSWAGVGVHRLLLVPKAAAGAPVEGELYYDAVAQKLKFWNGAAWETITSV